MSATATNNPPAQPESKTAKKKRAKAEQQPASTQTPSNADENKEESTVNGTADATNDFQSTFFRDLQKSLRNTTKKLNATAKVDNIIAENPGKSLDDLVAERKINPDQKAQALKKPALQAQVAQLEEQIAQYKKFAAYWEERLANEKASLENEHKAELAALREQLAAEYKESQEKVLRQKLLTLSQFLRAAATVRRTGDETAPESRAFEGVLFQVYGGTNEAVDSMLKLIDGADEKVIAVEGDTLDVTFARVRQVSKEQAPQVPEAQEETQATEAAPAADQTANAGAIESQEAPAAQQGDSTAPEYAVSTAAEPEKQLAPSQTAPGDGSNQQADASWNPQSTDQAVASTNEDGWVEVPRDPNETETGGEAAPAAAAQPSATGTEETPSATATANGDNNTNASDGFEPVVHHQRQGSLRGRGRGRGRGGAEGFRGGRGGGRGGDFRGRGRGRGDFRGGRGRGGFAQNHNRSEPIASQ